MDKIINIKNGKTMLSTCDVIASTTEQIVTAKTTPTLTTFTMKKKSRKTMKMTWATMEAAVPSKVFSEFVNFVLPNFEPK